MSKKDISRSIIEGGRAKRNKEYRKDSNQQHRAQNRSFSTTAKNLLDADDVGVTPKRKHVGKDFADKLGSAERWLASKVGQPWNDTYSELCNRFDLRTVAGRHAVIDHMLGWVTLPGDVNERWSSKFHVDDDGILRKSTSRRRRYRNGIKQVDINKWANGRRVMDYENGGIFWMVPQELRWVECGYKAANHNHWYRLCHRPHKNSTKFVKVYSGSVLAFERPHLHTEIIDGEPVYYREVPIKICLQGTGRYLQGERLSAKDLEFWNKLEQHDRDVLLWVLPKEARKKLPYKSDKRYSDFARAAY